MHSLYAAISPGGEVLGFEQSLQAATNIAGRTSSIVVVERHVEGSEAFGEFGAVDPMRMPELALAASALPVVSATAVMNISLAEAHRRLHPFFPVRRTRKDGTVIQVRAYETPMKMSRHILGQNYKTSKETPEQPSSVQGLSLLPYSMVKTLSKRGLPVVGKMKTLCAGASKACKAGCLVYSGHNTMDVYNIAVKISRTEALLAQPHAFARMMVENIRFHMERGPRLGWQPLVRLNVFSDIPWEIVFPDLFAMFRGLQFYDYTKVPGRSPPPNYDLTFSFSGANGDYVTYEIGRGRRIAVVFLLPGSMVARRTTRLPMRFLNLPVVDGDVSDVRPRDLAPSIVGLRWKFPHGQGVEPSRRENRAFVVPCMEVDGQIIAATSARQEPFVDADLNERDEREEG